MFCLFTGLAVSLPCGNFFLCSRDRLPGRALLFYFIQLFGGFGAFAHGLSQNDLLIRVQQGDLTNLLEIHPHGIVNGKAADKRIGVNQLFLLHIGNLLSSRLVIREVRQQVFLRTDFDIQRFQRVIELIHLFAFQIQIVHSLHQL